MKPKKEGEYVALGIAIGAGVGVALGVTFGNIPIGVALGISLGVAIGSGLEGQARARGELTPLTEEEKKKKQKYGLLVVGLGIVALAFLTFMYFN